MSKEDKQRTLATNRLLEILRQEQDSEDTPSSEDDLFGKDSSVDEGASELKTTTSSKKGPSRGQKTQDTDLFEAGHEIGAKDIENDLSDAGKFAWMKPMKESSSSDLETEGISKSKISESQPISPSSDLKNDLLLKTNSQNEYNEFETDDTVLPPEFNDSLISFIDDNKLKSPSKSWLKHFKRIFADTKRKITICVDQDTIYLLQTFSTVRKTKVEIAKAYSLPYEYENILITEINGLLSHILNNEIKPRHKKQSFGAYYSSELPSKTVSVTIPKLKKMELNELINWHANKNLSFDAENKTINSEIIKSNKADDTQDIIIGVLKNDSVNKINEIFNQSSFNLNFTTTLPILLWKSFVKNYPDKNLGTYVIVHIGESKTLVIVITNHVFQLSREIAIGAQDFYKAIIKDLSGEELDQEISNSLAKDILLEYGYPEKLTGVAAKYNIELNRITVAIRPVVERINSELNRTLHYFKNQQSDLEWKTIFFNGITASFPGLLEAIHDNIYHEVELLNPLRTDNYTINEDYPISYADYPKYSLNLALTSDEVETFNIASNTIRENNKYSFYNKIVIALLGLIIPLVIITSIFSMVSLKSKQRTLDAKKNELIRLAYDTKGYADYVDDLKIINTSNNILKDDRQYSENQIKIIKLFSSIVPNEIELTSIDFVDGIGLPDSVVTAMDFKEHIQVSGFVNNDKSVADIYLTDFILQIDKIPDFNNIKTIHKTNIKLSGKNVLSFILKIEL